MYTIRQEFSGSVYSDDVSLFFFLTRHTVSEFISPRPGLYKLEFATCLIDHKMETFISRRGRVGILVQGFRFRLDKIHKEWKTWRCCNKQCHSRCTTDLELTSILTVPSTHNHNKEDAKEIDLLNIRATCKRKAVEQPNERPLKLICTELPGESSINYNDINSIRRSMYSERRKQRPSLPTNQDEVLQALRNVKEYQTHDQDSLQIFVIDHDSKIVMLSSPRSLSFLASSPRLYADGTFKTCPKFFYQLYVLHAFQNGFYVPCVFFILPGKSQELYRKMLGHLLQVCGDLDINITTSTIYVDQEIAMISAVQSTFPDVNVKLCQFHIRQSWYRKIQSLGLCTEYKDGNSSVGKWLKLFFGLPAIDACDIQDCFAFSIMDDAPDSQACAEFADYVFKNYIDVNATFPPTTWTNQDEDGKTTNSCESFHKHFKDSFYSSHPNIFTFLEQMREQQQLIISKIKSVASGLTITKRKQQQIKNCKTIELISSYRNGEINQKTFLTQVCFKMLPVPL